MYPRITLDYNKLLHNTKILTKQCHQHNISVMGVSKVFSGWQEGVDALEQGGVDYIADSRIENLAKIKTSLPKVLLRLPAHSKIEKVVKFSDISLNSTLETIYLLDHESASQGKVHKIILMLDIGDLREGIYYSSDYIGIVEEVLKLDHIELVGIGTNLTCYGGVIPTSDTLIKLESIGKHIEEKFNINLAIKSFGNSSSIHLFEEIENFKYFNNLRLGESIIFGRETAYGGDIEHCHNDVVTLQAEIIEIYDKPSVPEGEIGVNAFGEEVVIKDIGRIKRGIIALGRQDVSFEHLYAKDTLIEIIGGSSDHTILNLDNTNYQVGDIIDFELDYSSVLSLTTSKYVERGVCYGKKD